jgi:hypothetical protein
VSALVLDAEALVAIDRDDRSMIARLRVAQQRRVELRTNAMVVAQVWRDRHGRQAGVLLGQADTATRSMPASSCWPSRGTGS